MYFVDPPPQNEVVFLVDDVPVVEQVLLPAKSRFYMALKYTFIDAKRELTDIKTTTLIFHEVSLASGQCRLDFGLC